MLELLLLLLLLLLYQWRPPMKSFFNCSYTKFVLNFQFEKSLIKLLLLLLLLYYYYYYYYHYYYYYVYLYSVFMVNREKRCLYTYRNSPISQYSPLNPAVHIQRYPLSVKPVWQVALFLQRFFTHLFWDGKIYEIRAIYFKVAAETLASLLTV